MIQRKRWPEGTGSFRRMQTVVMSGDSRLRGMLAALERPDTVVVATPLDVIARLESDLPIGEIVLAGSSPAHRELAAFLRETYPAVQLRVLEAA